jgi:hypothetical protein
MFYSDSLPIFSCKLLKMLCSHIGRPLVTQVLITSLPWRSVRWVREKGPKPRLDLKQSKKQSE